MLSKVVTSYLKARLSGLVEQVEPGEERTPFIRIQCAEPDFGDIELYDDGDEVTIYFGRFTHSHYSNYEEISVDQKEAQIAEDVHEVLKATLDDELEFWGSHQGLGGFQGVDYAKKQKYGFFSRIFSRGVSKTFYRWSGATRQTKS